jgi:hypothetical protein
MSLTGPYGGVEADYRRERITASFREHRKASRVLSRSTGGSGRRGGA